MTTNLCHCGHDVASEHRTAEEVGMLRFCSRCLCFDVHDSLGTLGAQCPMCATEIFTAQRTAGAVLPDGRQKRAPKAKEVPTHDHHD